MPPFSISIVNQNTHLFQTRRVLLPPIKWRKNGTEKPMTRKGKDAIIIPSISGPVARAHFYYAKKERVKMKYCPYCGADIPDGAVSFCAECGKALPVKKEKPEKSTPVKKSSAGKKKKHKSTVMTDAELRKAYNDGYDGYYEDLLPVDHGRERFETDSAPVKKIIILAAGVLVVIGLCVLMLYFV